MPALAKRLKESHLREEIGWQMESGQNEDRAFEIAARQIGQAGVLKNKFKKKK